METVETIYRQDALEALRTCYETERIDYTNGNEYINYEQAVHEFEHLPSAQPGIIHCKDCKYYRWEIDMCEYPYSTPHNVVHEYDYCSKAERKIDVSNKNNGNEQNAGKL